MHRRPLSAPSVVRAVQCLLRSLESWFRFLQAWVRSLQPWLQSLQSSFRAWSSRLRGLEPSSPSRPARGHRREPSSPSRPARGHRREPWFRSVPSRLAELPPALAAWFGGLRSLSVQSVFRDAERLARRPSRLTIGVAAGTVLAAGAILAGVSAGSAAPAAAVSDQDESRPAAPAVGAGHTAPSGDAGHAAPSGAGRAAPAAGAGHAARSRAARHAAPARAAASASASASGRSRESARHLARRAAPASPYLIYDSVTPGSIPASQDTVATYADGPHPTPASEVTGRKSVLWISITGQDYAASVVDVEPGNATPAEAGTWAWHRLSASRHAIARIYTMIGEWQATRAAVASFPAQMRARIHWWIADPTGSPHIVPGADATQWYWGSHYDITTAAPGF